MGIFDIFSNSDAQNAAQAQIGAYQSGFNQLAGLYGQGNSALQSTFGAGLNPVLQNVNTGQAGTTALGNALGLNGASGNAAALTGFMNNPGYQFQLQQGLGAVQAQQQAMGQGNSGNDQIALNNYAQGVANQNWNQYINSLSGYLPYSTQNANNALAGYSGLGTALNSNFTGQGNAAYGSAVGQGNAQAQADYANLQQSQNLWNLFGNIASGGMKMAGGGGFGGATGGISALPPG